MTFQRQINITQALGVEGDFASENPRFSVPSVEGGFKAGNDPNLHGVLIARFVWADLVSDTLVLNTGTGLPTGFLHRAMEGMNQFYFTTPSSTSFLIPSGFPVGEIFSGGTFFVRHRGTANCAVGMSAFAKNAHTSAAVLDGGTVIFDLATAVHAGYTKTKWIAGTPCLPNELTKMTSQPLG